MKLSKTFKWVALIHIGVILFAIVSFPSWENQRPKKRISVRTVQLQEKIERPPNPTIIPATNPSPKQTKVTKKTTPKKEKSKPTPKENPKKTKLIAVAKKSLETLRKKSELNLSIPRIAIEIPSLPGTTSDTKESEYLSTLIETLEFLVQLPEKKEVKLSLTLDKLGTIISIDNLESSSSSNKNHVLKTLKHAKLPPYGTLFGGTQNHTFFIQLLPDA